MNVVVKIWEYFGDDKHTFIQKSKKREKTMATVIFQKMTDLYQEKPDNEKIFSIVFRMLPPPMLRELKGIISRRMEYDFNEIEEIRLRSDRSVYITVGSNSGKKNIPLEYVTDKNDIEQIFGRMCNGSLYTYTESIVKGYISLDGGIRVGVCGRASTSGGRITGVYDISSLNIRLPHASVTLDTRIVTAIKKTLSVGQGVLIYSPPAEGKTTLLRSLGVVLAGGDHPMRVAFVDTREELVTVSGESRLSLDALSGYPRAEGISIATAFMNPEVIICDEIGSLSEAEAIVAAQNCGVPLIASAHGADLKTLFLRPQIKTLHEAHVFGLYVGIRISKNGGFEYNVATAKKVGESIEAIGSRTYTDMRKCIQL